MGAMVVVVVALLFLVLGGRPPLSRALSPSFSLRAAALYLDGEDPREFSHPQQRIARNGQKGNKHQGPNIKVSVQ